MIEFMLVVFNWTEYEIEGLIKSIMILSCAVQWLNKLLNDIITIVFTIVIVLLIIKILITYLTITFNILLYLQHLHQATLLTFYFLKSKSL